MRDTHMILLVLCLLLASCGGYSYQDVIGDKDVRFREGDAGAFGPEFNLDADQIARLKALMREGKAGALENRRSFPAGQFLVGDQDNWFAMDVIGDDLIQIAVEPTHEYEVSRAGLRELIDDLVEGP